MPTTFRCAATEEGRASTASPRRGHARTAARCCWSSSVARNDARLSLRSAPTEQGPPLSSRPAEGGGDRRGDADSGRRRSRLASARPRRRPVASWASHPGSPRARRGGSRPTAADRCSFDAARADGAADGRMGLGRTRTVARSSKPAARRPTLLRRQWPDTVATGRALRRGPSSGGLPPRRGSDDALRRTNSDTPTRSRWPAKEFH